MIKSKNTEIIIVHREKENLPRMLESSLWQQRTKNIPPPALVLTIMEV